MNGEIFCSKNVVSVNQSRICADIKKFLRPEGPYSRTPFFFTIDKVVKRASTVKRKDAVSAQS